METAPYEPTSDFLKAVIAEEVPLTGSIFGEANLARLIRLTRDADISNRDWATMLLAQEDIDTPQVRDALMIAARDEHDAVRGEAILGLAHRDRMLALPFAREALSRNRASLPLFEAVNLIAHADLVDDMRFWIEPSGDDCVDELAQRALLACQSGIPTR